MLYMETNAHDLQKKAIVSNLQLNDKASSDFRLYQHYVHNESALLLSLDAHKRMHINHQVSIYTESEVILYFL